MYRMCQHELYDDSVVVVNGKCRVNKSPNEYNFYMLSGVDLKVVNFEKISADSNKSIKITQNAN